VAQVCTECEHGKGGPRPRTPGLSVFSFSPRSDSAHRAALEGVATADLLKRHRDAPTRINAVQGQKLMSIG
jgi:hypothetical protein